MAYGVTVELVGMTKEQHDQMASVLVPKIKNQPGFLAHMSGPTANGYRITEAWESAELHTRWIENHVMPLAQQAGVTPPRPEEFEVEHVVTP